MKHIYSLFGILFFLSILGVLLYQYGLSIEFKLFVWFYFFIVSSFFFLKTRGDLSQIDPLSPAPAFIATLFLYSVASVLLVESTGCNNFSEPIRQSVLTEYYYCCILGILGFCIGNILVSPSPKVSEITIKKLEINTRKIHLYAIILGVILIKFYYKSFNIIAVESYAVRALESRIERMGNKSMGLIDILVANPPITLILCSCVVVFLSKDRKILVRVFAFGVFFLYIATNFMAGWRSFVIGALVIPLIYYNYKIKKLPVIPLAIIGIFVYVFTSISALVRHLDNVGDMIGFIGETYDRIGLQFLAVDKSGELLTGTNLMRQIDGIQNNEINYSYGTSIISEFLVYIPRALYSNRPLPLSEQFVDIFYPGIREKGGGYGFFCLQEGYWAFGMLGVFLFLGFYGWLVQKIYEWFRARFESDFMILMYSQFFLWMVVFSTRVGILGNIKAFLMYIIPFLIILPLPLIVYKRK
jgi:oligosaccharide repeat unit polymerase